MFIARRLKQENIAEYLLYMWQTEDLIRAVRWDVDALREKMVAPSHPSPEQEAEWVQWYTDLIGMMREENVLEKGHLQICKNVIIQLTDLHAALLRSPKYPFYSAAYYSALPFIVELRARKGGEQEEPELETCFDFLYGVMLLRLQKKEVGEETLRALKAVTQLLSMLSNFYLKEKSGELDDLEPQS